MTDCIFCKIIRGDIPSNKVYEDEEMLAFHDLNPQAPVHFLVIPKKHIQDIMDMEEADSALLGKLLYKAQELAKSLDCGERGARFVINCKAHGGQTVNHIHVHVLGGRFLAWPPG